VCTSHPEAVKKKIKDRKDKKNDNNSDKE